MNIPREIWFKLPLSLRYRWWKETNFNKTEPSESLAQAVEDAAGAIHMELPLPEEADE